MIKKQFIVSSLAVFSIGLCGVSCSDTEAPVGGGDGGPVSEDTLLQITTGGGSNPTVSPSGNLIGYEAFLSGLNGFAILDLSDSTVDSALAFANNPDWGPDEDTIAVNLTGLTVYIPSESKQIAYTNNANTITPDWNSNGRELVSHGDNLGGLFLTNFITVQISQIPCTLTDTFGCEGAFPSFAPDGQTIVFQDGIGLYTVDRSGGMARELIVGLNQATEPSWSPDSLWIAFSMPEGSAVGNHIWVVDARGETKGLHQITSGVFDDRNPCWGPDSDRIYFDRKSLAPSEIPEIWRILFDKTPVK